MRISVMVSVVVVAMVMVSGVRTTSCSRLFGLDRHRRAGLSFPLPKPVPVHAGTQNSLRSARFNFLHLSGVLTRPLIVQVNWRTARTNATMTEYQFRDYFKHSRLAVKFKWSHYR